MRQKRKRAVITSTPNDSARVKALTETDPLTSDSDSLTSDSDSLDEPKDGPNESRLIRSAQKVLTGTSELNDRKHESPVTHRDDSQGRARLFLGECIADVGWEIKRPPGVRAIIFKETDREETDDDTKTHYSFVISTKDMTSKSALRKKLERIWPEVDGTTMQVVIDICHGPWRTLEAVEGYTILGDAPYQGRRTDRE